MRSQCRRVCGTRPADPPSVNMRHVKKSAIIAAPPVGLMGGHRLVRAGTYPSRNAINKKYFRIKNCVIGPEFECC